MGQPPRPRRRAGVLAARPRPAGAPRRGRQARPIGSWDLDVGRGPGGAQWAVYTHCVRVCGRSHRTTLVTPFGRRPAPTGAQAEVVAGGHAIVLAPPAAKAKRRDRDRCSRWGGAHVVGCEIRVD